MVNKYWWLYFLIVAVGVFFFGSVLYTDIAYAAGLVLVPALIAGVILWRARSDTGVTAGFVVLVGILVYFGYDHYGDVREDSYRAMVEGCVSSISETQPQLSNEQAATLCTCVADEMSDTVMWQVTRDKLLFRETPPINENDELLPVVEEAWNVCLA
jgi:hypothetical protein